MKAWYNLFLLIALLASNFGVPNPGETRSSKSTISENIIKIVGMNTSQLKIPKHLLKSRLVNTRLSLETLPETISLDNPSNIREINLYSGEIVAQGEINSRSEYGTLISGLTPGKTYVIYAWGHFCYHYVSEQNPPCSRGDNTGNAGGLEFLDVATWPQNYYDKVYSDIVVDRVKGWKYTASEGDQLRIRVSESSSINWTDNVGNLYYRIYEVVLPSDQSLSPVSPCFYNQSQSQWWVGGPIDARTGNYVYQTTDLSIKGVAGDLFLQRTYSSLRSTDDGVQGYGWRHNYEINLTPNDGNGFAVIEMGDGSKIRFTIVSDANETVTKYAPLPGISAELTFETSLDRYILKSSDQLVYEFDTSGKLTKLTNAKGFIEYFIYTDGLLSQVTDDQSGRYLAFSYNLDGKLESVSTSAGRTISYTYQNGDLTSVNDNGASWAYEYIDHRLWKVLNPLNEIIERTEYDSQGRAHEQYNGNDELVVALTFDTDTTSVSDAFGNTTVGDYNNLGTPAQIERPGGTGTITVTYDMNFNITSITDALNNTSQLSWSANCSNPTHVEDAAGNELSLVYNSLNNPISMTDARGFSTTYEYSFSNSVSNLTKTKKTVSSDPLVEQETQYTYNAQGHLETVTSPGQSVTTYDYDAYGQIATITVQPTSLYADTISTYFTYDSAGRVKTQTDAWGRTDWTCYDAVGRVTRLVNNASGEGNSPQTDPCDVANYQPSTDISYDRINSNVYDDANRLIATIDEAQVITRYYYDAAGRQTTVVQNLYNQSIETSQPPLRSSNYPDRNIRTDYEYDDAGNLVATTDPLGRVTRTYYDALNRPVKVVQNFVGEISAQNPPSFDPLYPDRNLLTETVYDEVGNVIATINPGGRIDRTYYFSNQIGQPVVQIQNLTEWGIENSEPPSRTSQTASENLRTDILHDGNGNTIASQAPDGSITRNYYDGLNRQIAVVENWVGTDIWDDTPPAYDPNNPTQNLLNETRYDLEGRVIATIKPDGKITRTYYDRRYSGDSSYVSVLTVTNMTGQAIESELPPQFNPEITDQNIWSETISDIGGRTIATIDTYGRINRFYYDALGRQIYQVSHLQGQSINNPTPPAYSSTYPDQNIVTRTVYDGNGRVIASVDTLGTISRSYYDGIGRAVTVVQNLTGQDIYVSSPPAYNSLHPDQNIILTTVYDLNGQTIATIDTLGRISRSYYDGLGRNTAIAQNLQGQDISNPQLPAYNPTYPDRNLVTRSMYDKDNNQIAEIDPAGAITRTYYDGMEHAVTRVYNLTGQSADNPVPPARNPGSPLTDQNVRIDSIFDLAGNQIAVVNGKGTTTAYEYDDLARLTVVIENQIEGVPSDNQTNVRTEYSYDVNGNRVSILDGNGHSSYFSYDELGRLIEQRDALNHVWSYSYDALGNQVAATNPNGFSIYQTYDAQNRLKVINYPNDPDVSFYYDGIGNMTRMVDGLGQTSWTYDKVGRIKLVSNPFGHLVSSTYDGLGNRTQLILTRSSANFTTSYGYDGLNRLTYVFDWRELTTQYTYNNAGRLSTIILPNNVVTARTYNALGQVTQIEHIGALITLAKYQYQYDFDGNVTSAIEKIAPLDLSDKTISYAYDNLDHLTQANYFGNTIFNYTYDAVGNRISEQQGQTNTNYTYDDANRLTSVNGITSTWDANGNLINDGIRTYVYDQANRLKTIQAGSVQYGYRYDGLGNRYQQFRVGATTTYSLDLSSGLSQVLSDGTNMWLYGIDKIGQYKISTISFVYPLVDRLGSLRQMVNASRVVLRAQRYAPYGTLFSGTGLVSTPLGFTGEWTDDSGLLNLRARYYAPQTGRFISRDSWEGDAEAPMSYNAWLYGYANPVMYTDPSGNRPGGPDNIPIEKILKRYIDNGYNEKVPPPGVSFDPATTAESVSSLPPGYIPAQIIPIVASSRRYTPEGNQNGSYHSGLCGDISILWIFEHFRFVENIYIMYWKHYDFLQEEWVCEGGIGGCSAEKRDLIVDYSQNFELAMFINQNYSFYEAEYGDFTNFSEAYTKVREGLLHNGPYYIVGININGDTGQLRNGSSQKFSSETDVMHWVVINGFSRNWDFKWSPDVNWKESPMQWVRIYNPFDDDLEYYWWSDFKNSWLENGKTYVSVNYRNLSR